MAIFLTEDQVIARIGRLTHMRLVHYVEARVVRPLTTAEGPRFRPVDLARLELLCELSEEFDLEDDALGVVVSLLDQLHDARADLHALAEAVAAEPREVRTRIGTALTRRRG